MICLYIRRWRPAHAVFALVTLASLLAVLAAASPRPAPAVPDVDPDRRLTERDLKPLAFRSIGPANMGGRVAAIATPPGDDRTIYLGYGTGGVWKSTNRGTTFAPIFDRYETSSIGSIAVADVPEDWPGWEAEEAELTEARRSDLKPRVERGKGKILWVGTGESNGRNSSSWGHGVYRSTDAGESFTNVGLVDSHDIPAIVAHPSNPEVCFVAAQGHLWGENEMRGVYKTTDGGATWNRTLFVDTRTGACDIVIDPDQPDTLYAAMYSRLRTPYSFESGGPAGGIFRSDDGGNTWTKLSRGLPATTGRIGLSVFPGNSNIVYAIVDSNDGGKVGEWHDNRSRAGGVFRTLDRGETWQRMCDINPRPFYFSKIRVDPKDANRVYVIGWSIFVSDDGGRTFRGGLANVPHVDFHAMIVCPADTDHLMVGTDGGFYVSWDRGKTWDFHNSMAVGQFYNVAVDDSDPYRIGGGLQDNGSWIGVGETLAEGDGKYMGRKGALTNEDWRFIFGGDGFHVAFDPVDENIVYAEWQGGNIARVHLDTGVIRNIKPTVLEGQIKYRFNWNAPLMISPHDPSVLYLGGNAVFRLTERGNRWEQISDDLSTRELTKVMTEGSTAETHGTVVALTESPAAQGVLWAGTDDGLIHVTAGASESWKNVTPAVVAGRYISKIEASRFDRDTAYVAVDGHRTDDFEAVILKTSDLGETWTNIAAGLADGAPVKVVREDPSNADVLYVGTERAAWVTIDGGATWVRMNGEVLPTVAVDDIAIQPREHDVVLGTHGRSVWVLDDASPIAQLNADVVQSIFHVFTPKTAVPRYRVEAGALWSDAMFVAPNPPMGALITYWVREFTDEDVKVTIATDAGVKLVELTGTNRPGMNRVVWDLQPEEKQRIGNPDGLKEFVPAGTYDVTVTLGKRTKKVKLEVASAPSLSLPQQ